MGNVQPTTIQPGLGIAVSSTDNAPPSAVLTSPAVNSVVRRGASMTLLGTSSDVAPGVVAGVEVSVDGGVSWRTATGRESWSYTFTPETVGMLAIMVRATDDSCNVGSATPSVPVQVVDSNRTCVPAQPCSIWDDAATPVGFQNQPTAVELGVKVQSSDNGSVTGIRFYKADTNATHTVSLWDSSGHALATATSANGTETSSGWQTVQFSPAVVITANTTYVASYHIPSPGGFFALDRAGWTTNTLLPLTSSIVNLPLQALADGQDGRNGVFSVGPTQWFPNGSKTQSSNYWVDVLFSATGSGRTCAPSQPCSIWPATATPASSDSSASVELGVKVQSTQAGFVTGIRFYKADLNSTHTVHLWDRSGTLLATANSTSESSTGWQTGSFAQAVAVSANTTYVASYLMPGGNFALDRPGFTSAVVNAPLQALADGQDGGNGVYGSSSSFPSSSLRASNYWVDVLFTTP